MRRRQYVLELLLTLGGEMKEGMLLKVPTLGVCLEDILTSLFPEWKKRRIKAASYILQGRLRYRNLARWLTRHARKKLARLHLLTLPTEDEVLAEGTLFCREYIARRLRAGELLPPNLEHAAAPWGDTHPGKESNRAKCLLQTGAARCGAVNSELQAAGEHLDAMYPDLYDSLTGQLEMTLRSEDEAHNTLLAVSRHLYKRQVTWGKVVAGLALTAALAADCVRQGHPEYVKDVVEAFIKVMQRHTAPWIVKQGGWADVIQVCRGSSGTPIFWAFSLIGATIGFSLTILLIGNV